VLLLATIGGCKKSTQDTPNETQTIAQPAPPLDNPGEWLKPLQDIKDKPLPAIEYLKNVSEIQRYIALMEYANATNDNALYFQAKNDFFKSLKRSMVDGPTRIEFILEIWPEMMRRNNFDGLKDAMMEIDIMMDKKQVPNDAKWAYYNAVLAGFALALNDEESSEMYMKAGGYNAKYLIDIPNAVAWKPINADEVFDTLPGQSIDMDDSSYYYFCKIAIHLAKKGDAVGYMKFIANAKKRGNYRDSIAYSFAIADATLGEFDRAWLHWKQYIEQSCNSIDSQDCMFYISRQEFLAGEFRSWESKKQIMSQYENISYGNEKNYLKEITDGSNYCRFYFDFGRGIARHKTDQEILEKYGRFSSNSNADVFFLAGVATGLQDKKNPK